MALFRIFKGNEANLPEKKREGFAYFTIDESDFYIDTEDTGYNSDGSINSSKPGVRQQLNAKRARYLKSKDLNRDNEHDLYIDDEEISLGRKAKESNYELAYDSNALGKAGFRSIAVGSSASATGNYSSSFGTNTTAQGLSSHAEGVGTLAEAEASHVEGVDSQALGYGSHAEGVGTGAAGEGSHTEGFGTLTDVNADYAHAEGKSSQANGKYSHAEGDTTKASGESSHSEGSNSEATGIYSHAEGWQTKATAQGAHAEGQLTVASQVQAHAEGFKTEASGAESHAEGDATKAEGHSSHSEGTNTEAIGDWTHAEGYASKAHADYSHAEGKETNAQGAGSHTEGYGTLTTADGVYGHAEGQGTTVSGTSAHAEGTNTTASGSGAHAEGNAGTASGDYSHSEGNNTTSSGGMSHAEGNSTSATGLATHAEGSSTTAKGNSAHAEGKSTTANGNYSHAEGFETVTNDASETAHAEGYKSKATGIRSHAQNSETLASGESSHAEGISTTASGKGSHAQNLGTIASGESQTAIGKYNIADTTSALIVGNGTSTTARSNAFTIDWNGNAFVAGKITQGTPSSDATIVNMNRFQSDVFVSGDGSAPNSPKVAGFYLGKSASDENRHLDIVSGADHAYIDFNKASTVEDYKTRLIVNVSTGNTKLTWNSSATDKLFAVEGNMLLTGDFTINGALTVKKLLTAQGGVYANRGSTTSVASLWWNKNGTNYGGIGYNGVANENYLGPCDGTGAWKNAETDSWRIQGKVNITNDTAITGTLRIDPTTSDYCEGIRIAAADTEWVTIALGTTAASGTHAKQWAIHRKNDGNFCIAHGESTGSSGMFINTSGKVGFGTVAPSYKLHVVGDIYADGGWFRVSGNNGYYFESHGGGWYMKDANYIRTHNNKKVIAGNSIYIGTTAGAGTGLSLYSESDPTTYGIHMSTTANYSRHGDVQSDWATYFNMNAVGQRGWIYRAGSTNVASISCNGIGTFAGVGNNSRYLAFPQGGEIQTNGSNGYLIIELPVLNTSTMIKFKVSIYDYVEDESCDYIISGYNYSDGVWYNPTAICLGKPNKAHSNLTVRYGQYNGHSAISIGEANTAWQYPNITISDVTLGHSGTEYYDEWSKGWRLLFSTTAISNISKTITGTHMAQVSGTINKVAKFTAVNTVGDSNITDDGSTVTIGTKLVVKGNGSSYNEGIRILPASNGWSNIFFSDDQSVSGQRATGWLMGRRGAAGSSAGAIGDFTIEVNGSNGTTGMTLTQTGVLNNSGEIISRSANGFRIVQGNYGVFVRNDGSNTYFLLTASGDQYGTWNTLRPLYINNATGAVTMGNGLTVNGNIIGNLQGSADYAKKIETYYQNDTTKTYGTSYPIFAQWNTSNVVFFKCTGYSVGTDYATKLTNSSGTGVTAGSTSQPVYFNAGLPVAIDWRVGNQNIGEHNCNNITYNFSGYYTSSGPATTLGASTNDGAIWSQAYNATWVAQIAQDYRDGALFVRGKNNGTWTAWLAIPHSTTATVGSAVQPIYLNNGAITACTTPVAGNWWGTVSTIGSDGVMEVGKYFDFHLTDTGTADYDIRLEAKTDGLYVQAKKLATVDDITNALNNFSGGSQVIIYRITEV